MESQEWSMHWLMAFLGAQTTANGITGASPAHHRHIPSGSRKDHRHITDAPDSCTGASPQPLENTEYGALAGIPFLFAKRVPVVSFRPNAQSGFRRC